jgi:coenzyme F420 hydrogenase subunit beta
VDPHSRRDACEIVTGRAVETPNWNALQRIIRSDLYTRSGTEVGVSGGALELVEDDGDYTVRKVIDGDIPRVCLDACTDLGADYPALNRAVFGRLPANWLIGNYERIFVGHITDEAVRRNGSSGGVISGAQLYLLEQGDAEGAITLCMRRDRPYLTEAVVATTREEILAGAKSKYTTAPLNHILADLPGPYRSLSYTGLPEEVASIRTLQTLGHPSVQPISHVFGTFYGEAIGFSAVRSFLRAHRVKDVGAIRSLAFRAGEWPGCLRIELADGRVIAVRKFHANYLIPSHITTYSLYQVDYTAELADISVGDAWAPSYEARGGGWSVVIGRTPRGLALLERMHRDGRIALTEVSADDLIQMHSHGLDLKKRGAFIRIDRRRARGLPVPEYGYRPVNVPASRRRFEALLDVLFAVFRLPATIWTLEHLPIPFIGWFFVHARSFWKARTKSTKKGGLSSVRFELTARGP